MANQTVARSDQNLDTLLNAARAAQRAGNLDAAREAQRAYDRARNDAAREAQRERRSALVAQRIAEVDAHLSNLASVQLRDVPAGLCSRSRAEYLMMAASVAGGAIYVDCPPIDGRDDAFIAIGTIGGEPVADVRTVPVAEIRRLLVDQIRGWMHPSIVLELGEYIDSACAVLDSITDLAAEVSQ